MPRGEIPYARFEINWPFHPKRARYPALCRYVYDTLYIFACHERRSILSPSRYPVAYLSQICGLDTRTAQKCLTRLQTDGCKLAWDDCLIRKHPDGALEVMGVKVKNKTFSWKDADESSPNMPNRGNAQGVLSHTATATATATATEGSNTAPLPCENTYWIGMAFFDQATVFARPFPSDVKERDAAKRLAAAVEAKYGKENAEAVCRIVTTEKPVTARNPVTLLEYANDPKGKLETALAGFVDVKADSGDGLRKAKAEMGMA